MGFRNGNKARLTIAMAFVDRFVSDEADYFRKKSEIGDDIDRFVTSNYDFDEVKFGLNVLDAKGRGIDGLYLTVLGTSADAGDSGQVGRGNNVVGVIPLNRPMSSEAAAGKNPVSHVGKIYNLLSYRIADQVHTEGQRDQGDLHLAGQQHRAAHQRALRLLGAGYPRGRSKHQGGHSRDQRSHRPRVRSPRRVLHGPGQRGHKHQIKGDRC